MSLIIKDVDWFSQQSENNWWMRKCVRKVLTRCSVFIFSVISAFCSDDLTPYFRLCDFSHTNGILWERWKEIWIVPSLCICMILGATVTALLPLVDFWAETDSEKQINFLEIVAEYWTLTSRCGGLLQGVSLNFEK